jgi:flavin-dependent dehydrogenase
MLNNKARSNGAVIFEETAARGLIRNNGRVLGVEAENRAGEQLRFEAPVTVDASGRDAFAMVREGWRVRDPKLNKVAIWTYYRGAKRDPGLDEGATTVAYLPGRGWFWFIPLQDDIVSVGIVAERDYLFHDTRDPNQIFEREIPNNPWIEEHLKPGQQVGEYWITGEYSYRSRHCARDGLVLTGDAFGFLDPVFSSGVFLALKSGVMAADAIGAALDKGDVSASRFADYGASLCQGIENMRKLVYAFYDPAFSFGGLIKEHPHLRGPLTDCLIGDLFEQDFGELFSALADSADIPEPLSHGGIHA